MTLSCLGSYIVLSTNGTGGEMKKIEAMKTMEVPRELRLPFS